MNKSQTYPVESTPAVIGSVLMWRFRLCLGQCGQLASYRAVSLQQTRANQEGGEREAAKKKNNSFVTEIDSRHEDF